MPGSAIASRLDHLAASGALDRAHAVVITRDGATVAEHFRSGADARWGERLGVVEHGPATLHDLRSVTKTVTGLLYGIAHEEGLVPPPEARLVDHLPAHRRSMEAAGSADLTVAHVLSKTMGTAWREELPYADARNGEIAMELARDRDAYILSQPRTEPAGTRWRYSGGATAILGTLLETGTGASLPRFAAARLLGPLGIDTWQWMAGGNGHASPASGLRLSATGLARVGALLLDGAWRGRQVVPRAWLERATTVAAERTWSADAAYGFHVYLGGSFAPGGAGPGWRGGIGNGGQYVMALPDSGIVAAVLTGAYDQPDQGVEARAVLSEVIAPSLA